MSRTWPVPRVPGQYTARPTYRQRIRSGLHPGVRRELQVRRDADLAELAALDRQLEALSSRRVELLDRLDLFRDRLWPEVPECRGRRPPALDAPPLPPLVQNARRIGGGALRALCLTMLGRQGPMSLPDMHALVHRYGYRVDSEHEVKALADAMAYEVRCGRAIRVRRGVYEVAPFSPPGRGVSPDPRRGRPRPVEIASWSDVPVDTPLRTDPDRWIPGEWSDGDGGDPTSIESADRTADAAPAAASPPAPPALGADSAQIRPRRLGEQAEGRSDSDGGGSRSSSDTRRSHTIGSVVRDEGPP